MGAALTATSVGIAARVFRDLGTLDSDESRIVLGAAVVDDVLGLVILIVVVSFMLILGFAAGHPAAAAAADHSACGQHSAELSIP